MHEGCVRENKEVAVKGGGTAFGGGWSKPPVTVWLSPINSGCRHCLSHSTCFSKHGFTPSLIQLNPSSSSSSSSALSVPVCYYTHQWSQKQRPLFEAREISLSLLYMVPSSLVQFVRLLCRTCTSIRKKLDLMGPLRYHTVFFSTSSSFFRFILFFIFKLCYSFFFKCQRRVLTVEPNVA